MSSWSSWVDSVFPGAGSIGSALYDAANDLADNVQDAVTGGGQPDSMTITQNPWSGQQPYLLDLFQKAQDLYNKNPSMFVGPSSYTQQGISMLSQGSNPFGNAAQNMGMNTMSGGYLNANPAMSGLNAFGSGQNMWNPAFGSLSGMAQNGPRISQNATNALEQTAAGNFLNGSPYLNSQIDNAFNRIKGKVDSQFAMGGRGGSGLHANAMADSFSNAATNLLGQNYQMERGNQLNAANQLGALGNQNFANQLQANMGLGNLYQGAQGMQLNALGQMGSLWGQERNNMMQAMGMAPAFQQMQQQNINNMLNAGKITEGYEQNKANAPWLALQNYQNAISGNYGGSKTQPLYNNPMSGLLGGGLMGYAMTGSPWGALAGAGAGYYIQ